MELKWLEDFLSLSQHYSFSRAANDRHITQSALSRRIKQLEDWVGMPLIDRSTNPIRLTAAGQKRYAPMWEILSFATLNTLSLTFFPAWMAELETSGDSFRARFADPHSSFLGNISTLVNGDCDFFLTY
eukprot:gene30145-37224_t